ncbi:hypothetical protein GGR16_003762 [Chelatococcus caeni]|uniref:O-antigen ligase domain-containing protein n=1 Tax=Chelatococcus caeni TaxID=1348468 RepID=A0A840BZF4_9HYPH|nr:hypothetical protein [Chelatococcus caeni]MBB4018715.1 hypothetical protein [Chelatococcus caeni]
MLCVFLAASSLAAALPVAGHLAFPALGPVMSLVLALCLLQAGPAMAPPLLLFVFTFQNSFVAILLPLLPDAEAFDTVRGYNFLTAALLWAGFAAFHLKGRTGDPQTVRRLMALSFAMIAAVAAYCALGAAADPRGAVVYLRNIALPVMLFQIGLVAGARLAVPVARFLPALMLMVLAFGYAELLAYDALAALVNADGYLALRFRRMVDSGFWLKAVEASGRVLRDERDMLLVNLFNVPWFADLGLVLRRLNGPNFHPISFSYLLGVLSLVLLAAGRPLYLVAAVPLLVVIGSKGTVAFLLMSLAGFWLLRHLPRLAVPTFLLLLMIYAAAAFVVGLEQRDYHVLGLVAGFESFTANPLGHGLGSGGNLAADPAVLDWRRAQSLGMAGQAVESALGVLLHQMGIGCLGLLAGYILIARSALRLHRAGGEPVLAAVGLAVPAMLVNGAFQEEALFAPLAMGALLLIAGLAIGRETPP